MYDIIFQDAVVGSAEVKKEGLYYRFVCNCMPPDKELYRIHVSDGVYNCDLGICVPEGRSFFLNTRVASKYFTNDHLSFRLTPEKIKNKRIAVTTDTPFDELDQLETARFQMENGQASILIDPVPDQPDSDLNQEHEHRSR